MWKEGTPGTAGWLILSLSVHVLWRQYDLSMTVPVPVPMAVILTGETQHVLPELKAVVPIAQEGNYAGPGPTQILLTSIQVVTEVPADGDMCSIPGDGPSTLHAFCCSPAHP